MGYIRVDKSVLLASLTAIVLTTSCAMATKEKKITESEDGFHHWVETFSKENNGVSARTLQSFQSQVDFVPKAIELDRKQPHATKTFPEYLEVVLPPARLKKAEQKLKEHASLLEEIGKKYGVQPSFIVALWGVESDFGDYTGHFNTLNSLATLAYEGRRGAFFKKELITALKIIDAGDRDMDNMFGSWAGAMGQTQFMPSSYEQFAQDYDGDGKRDIWNNPADIFASIAQYLSHYGWDDNSNWGVEVTLPKHFDNKLIETNNRKTLTQWRELGVKPSAAIDNLPDDGTAYLVQPEKGKAKTYLVYPNFRIIMKWNRSTYFATTVGIFSDYIGKIHSDGAYKK